MYPFTPTNANNIANFKITRSTRSKEKYPPEMEQITFQTGLNKR